MENLDEKLYQDYKNGEKEAFEHLYNKYKNKIQYFINNIIKDKEKAEDIAQETFIYVLQHPKRDGYSFKYYIYLVAKSRAINYINTEKNRNEINEKYLSKEETVENDIYEIVAKKERQKEIIDAINQLDDKYKNAIYLVNIEGLSYKETAQILDESVSNIKTIIHRGKKELKKILIERGYVEMNKVIKTLAAVICSVVILSGIVYAAKNKIDFSKFGFLKVDENYSDSATIVNKSIENEYMNITLESVGGDNSYIIVEYTINFKDKAIQEFEPIIYNQNTGYNIGIASKVNINDEEQNTNIMKVFNKISDSEYQYVQIINIMDNEEKEFNLDIYLDTFYVGTSYNTASNKVYIDKKISTKISRQENKNFEEKEQVLDNNKKVVIEDVENTKFETFIKGKYVKEGITWKEYQNVNMEYSSFLVSTDNGEKIQSIIYQGDASGIDRYVKNSDNEYEKIEDYSTIKNSDIVKVEEHFLILLGRQENINNLLVTPTETKLYNDRTDEEERMYKKATWYQVKPGKTQYTAKSTLGGTLTINNITVDNDYITFYYYINGYIGDETLVLVRDKSVDDMNYFYATNEYKKDVNGEENKIEFSLKDEPRSGLNTYKISLKNIDNLEFTLLFGSNTKIIGEPFKISIPDRDNDDLKFKNIEISDCNFDREDAIMYLNDDISGVIFDNIIITDSNMQVKGKTSTIVENITDMNKETVFITDDSGKKYYNFSSSVNSNEFTMYFKINKKILKKDKLYINVLKDGKISTSELIRK